MARWGCSPSWSDLVKLAARGQTPPAFERRCIRAGPLRFSFPQCHDNITSCHEWTTRSVVRHLGPEMAYVDAPGWASADSEPRFVAVWSGTVVCPASGCGSRWPRARMVFVRSDPNRTSGLAGPSPFPGFSDPVSRPFAPTPFVRPCRPTSPSASFPLSPLRRPWEPGRPPFSCSAPRPAAPSCWRGPPRRGGASSPCGPASRPATDPRSRRSASPSGRPTWLR